MSRHPRSSCRGWSPHELCEALCLLAATGRGLGTQCLLRSVPVQDAMREVLWVEGGRIRKRCEADSCWHVVDVTARHKKPNATAISSSDRRKLLLRYPRPVEPKTSVPGVPDSTRYVTGAKPLANRQQRHDYVPCDLVISHHHPRASQVGLSVCRRQEAVRLTRERKHCSGCTWC